MNHSMVKFTQRELDEINPTLKTAEDAINGLLITYTQKLQKLQVLEQKILFWLT